MIILWSLLLIAAASAHKVVDSTEDIGPEAFANVTTLYPVANKAPSANITNDDFTVENTTNTNNTNVTTNEEKHKPEATGWKIEAAFAESNLETENNTRTPEDTKNETKEFKPSQHLGSFVDLLENAPPTESTYSSFTPIMKPTSGFVSSKEEYRATVNKVPKELFNTHKEYPYKFESSIFTRAKQSWKPDRQKPWPQGTGLGGLGGRPGKGWDGNSGGNSPGKDWGYGNSGFGGIGDRPRKEWDGNVGLNGFGDRPKGWDSLEPEPTQQSLLKVPAGGLYKYPDPFKEKPGNHDDDFGLEFNNDGKETVVKKRGNPWEGVLRMLTAFIPVGLIISALTPSIITIENTAPGSTYPSNVFRRAGSASELAELPAISERCRRRLLCELHAETNYLQDLAGHPRKWKQCHRIRCEDQDALARSLRWLLQKQAKPYT